MPIRQGVPIRPFHRRLAHARRLGLSAEQARLLARLNTPQRIQDYLTAMPINFEPDGDTCMSVAAALREGRAHCIEAAFIAACALWIAGGRPLLLDFQAKGDDDHVVAPFRQNGYWGAISKSNHVWLRWRDPVYRTVRELAMSYFHEYTKGAKKTLMRYSRPFDLSKLDPATWVTSDAQCWDITGALDSCKHYAVAPLRQRKLLRQRDEVEIRGSQVLQFKAPDRKRAASY